VVLYLYRPVLVCVAFVVGALIGAEIPLLMTLIQRIRPQDAASAHSMPAKAGAGRRWSGFAASEPTPIAKTMTDSTIVPGRQSRR
jgi:hypothetical protein